MEYGFTALDADRTMFKLERDGKVIIVALYVDDGLVAHNCDTGYQKFINALSQRFELSADANEVSWYLGVSITRDWERGTMKLSQEQYVNDLLKRFNMKDCNTVLTPMEVGVHLTLEGCPEVPDKAVVKHYQQLIGTLNYLVAWTMPELVFPVSQCARFMSNPSPDHVAAAKRILRYVKGTKDVGITYTRDSTSPNQLYAFVDADHAGDPEGLRSVTGYIVMMNGGAISWESKRQKVTALSSAESERIADAMGFVQVGPTLVAEDNVVCIYMSKSSAMYHKAKAIDTRVYLLQEFVADGVMELYYVATADQAADCFTKSLPSEAVRRH
eukprot:3934228-Rhodomonas_salina.1